MKKAIVNATVFNGEDLFEDHAVVIDGKIIDDVLPRQDLAADIAIERDLQGGLLVPGFIDIQVNGGGGVLFNDTPTVETIRTIGRVHRRYGTTGFLPTLITGTVDVMQQALEAVAQAIAEQAPGVLGIHLEGPYLNKERKGAHDAAKFRLIDEAGLDMIASLRVGKTLITIAPELTTPGMIKRIVDAGVIVCAGHSTANYQQAREALKAGISGFTHLFNAMMPLQSRDPGMVGAALDDERGWFSIIADGYHNHPTSFRIAVNAKKPGGALLVTDAMPTVGAVEKSFRFGNETIHSVNGRCSNAAGSLVGSDLDMISAVNNTADFAKINWFEAVRMASLYPARALGIADTLGYIKPDYIANFVGLDANREIVATWIDGVSL